MKQKIRGSYEVQAAPTAWEARNLELKKLEQSLAEKHGPGIFTSYPTDDSLRIFNFIYQYHEKLP